MLTAGAVASAGIWVAPTIVSLDPASAAIGSCPAPPRRVDFSRFAGANLPSTFLSDDGTVTINFSQLNPDGVQDPNWDGVVFNGTLNGLDNPVINGMENAVFGDYVEFRFDFSIPVCPSFFLVDVDRGGWEDTVRVTGRDSGGNRIDPANMILGGTQVQVDSRTVRGTTSTTSPNGNVEVQFGDYITRLEVRHSDVTNLSNFQWIGVHDFHWC